MYSERQDHHEGSGKAGVILGFFAGVAATLLGAAALMRVGKSRAGMRQEAWALRAKSEVLKRMADAEDMGEREFKTLVDLVTQKYGQGQAASKEKVAEVARQIKARWKKLKEEARRGDGEGDEEEELLE